MASFSNFCELIHQGIFPCFLRIPLNLDYVYHQDTLSFSWHFSVKLTFLPLALDRDCRNSLFRSPDFWSMQIIWHLLHRPTTWNFKRKKLSDTYWKHKNPQIHDPYDILVTETLHKPFLKVFALHKRANSASTNSGCSQEFKFWRHHLDLFTFCLSRILSSLNLRNTGQLHFPITRFGSLPLHEPNLPKYKLRVAILFPFWSSSSLDLVAYLLHFIFS